MDQEKITTYIQKNEKWVKQLTRLRKILNSTELKEEVKWGMPTYTLDNKNLVGLAGFKNHYCLWFHQGVFLKDPHGLLHNAQEGKTKAMRQMRFLSEDKINQKKVLQYINESIANHRAGKVIKNEKPSLKFKLDPLLAHAFKKDAPLKKSFKSLSPGKQKEYSLYITEAKREATKLSRLEKIIPLIKEGKGLMDKYIK